MDRRYVILEALGAGGMGTVYRARREGPAGFSKEVAIKLAAPSFSDEDALEILADEARVLGVVSHRAVVQTDGLVRLAGCWALVMEYVEGTRLDVLVGAGTLPLRASLGIVAEIGGALHVAQNSPTPRGGGRLGLSHRDLKPSNLLVTAGGSVKILDFGIALSAVGGRGDRFLESNQGSEDYMSPERLQGVEGPADDIYSLGVVLYEMLVGSPFGRTTTSRHPHQLRCKLAGNALMRSEACNCVGLADFVLRMLSYDPAQRPAAREVERRCEDWASQAPGVGLRDYAEVAVPGLIDRQRSDVARQSGAFLAEGTVLTEEFADHAGPVSASYTPRTPSSGGLGLGVVAEPAISPIEIVRALLAQSEPDTVKRVGRRYRPDTGALDDERWLDDGSMMRYLAWFAAISLMVALGLAAFVLFHMARSGVAP